MGATMAQFTVTGGGPLNGTPPDPATMIARRVSFLTTLLSLTDAQASQATTIFTNAATAATTPRTSLSTAQQSMQDAVKSNNTQAIDQLSATIGTLTGQITSIQNKAEAAFYAILTTDQKAKLDQLDMHGLGPRIGIGGFGAPPAPPQ